MSSGDELLNWKVVVLVLFIGLILGSACLLLPGPSTDEKMLSSWMRQAVLLSASDYDHDGENETWAYDTNMDGVADFWIKVHEESMPDGVERITTWQKDRDYDGRIDWEMTDMLAPYMSRNPPKTVAEDTNGDGLFDYVAFIRGGRRIPSMISYDTDGDGKYDRVVWFDKHGKPREEERSYFLPEVARKNNGATDPCGFNYREYDSDMDGRMDVFEVLTKSGYMSVNHSLLDNSRD